MVGLVDSFFCEINITTANGQLSPDKNYRNLYQEAIFDSYVKFAHTKKVLKIKIVNNNFVKTCLVNKLPV
jgi:hypothetical protein